MLNRKNRNRRRNYQLNKNKFNWYLHWGLSANTGNIVYVSSMEKSNYEYWIFKLIINGYKVYNLKLFDKQDGRIVNYGEFYSLKEVKHYVKERFYKLLNDVCYECDNIAKECSCNNLNEDGDCLDCGEYESDCECYDE